MSVNSRSPGGAAGGADDRQDLLAELVDGVERVLPGAEASGVLVVSRDRTLADRLAGRPGALARVRLVSAEAVLTLAPARGRASWIAEIERVSEAVMISRRSLPIGEWLTAFAGRVAAIAAETSGDQAAASTALQQLGIRIGGADVRVEEATLAPDLQALSSLLAGRLPSSAQATVGRIAALLVETIPRVEGRAEAEATLRRAATVSLPDILRAYLARPVDLAQPADEAQGHEPYDHSTPAIELQAQLALLERSVSEVRASALADDAAALLTNGRFLASRFTPPRLDLR